MKIRRRVLRARPIEFSCLPRQKLIEIIHLCQVFACCLHISRVLPPHALCSDVEITTIMYVLLCFCCARIVVCAHRICLSACLAYCPCAVSCRLPPNHYFTFLLPPRYHLMLTIKDSPGSVSFAIPHSGLFWYLFVYIGYYLDVCTLM